MANRKGRLTDKELTAIIHTGVSFQKLQDMIQATYTDPKKVAEYPDPAGRAEMAKKESEQWLASAAGKIQAKEGIDNRTREIMDWIRSTRCEKEGFWKQIGMHLMGALATALVGLVLYFFISLFVLLHQGDPASQAAGKWAAKLVHLIPDAGEPPHQDTSPSKSVPDGQ